MTPRSYHTRRFKLPLEKGPFFYILFNIRLFFFLFFQAKPALLISNDLDTLLPNYLVSSMKGIPLIYDSHEYFTEVPELTNRPWVRKFWLRLEEWIFPKLKFVMTVNESIAEIYRKKYRVPVSVVRNVPMSKQVSTLPSKDELRVALEIPRDHFIIILQGSGINIQRGAEELILAMKYLENCFLLIIGGGDRFPALREMVQSEDLNNRVRMVDRVPAEELYRFTKSADLGISLDKPLSLNYLYSLPNKLFDYLQASLPVLVSDLPEVAALVRKYQAGMVISSYEPINIANAIDELRTDKEKWKIYHTGAERAAHELRWESESKILSDLIKSAGAQ